MASKIHSKPEIEVLFSEEEIATRIKSVAGDIADAGLDDFVVIAVLSGSFVFAADLIRAFHHYGLSPEVDFLTLSSYGGEMQSSGKVSILRDFNRPVLGRNVLIVDDILESGRTMNFAKKLIMDRGARSVSTCALLDKKNQRVIPVSADFSVFECPDVFVVGYGMDLDHRLRELPYIGRIMQ